LGRIELPHSQLSYGASLIDLIISLGIIVLLFGGIIVVYFALGDAVRNTDIRRAAAAMLNNQIEIIRNMSYENVGTQGGIPPGIIPQQQIAAFSGYAFQVNTSVRYIDDPFDGVLGGSPNDTNPADYKVVDIKVNCVTCSSFTPLGYTTTVAPKGLESSSSTGSLFINVFDSNGASISGASTRVANSSVTPFIDLTDTTGVNGMLQLVGVPSGTQSYQISVSKTGYSADRNYPAGDSANPNPINPYATVAAQTLTTVSFSIDKVSSVKVLTSDKVCAPYANKRFSLSGLKLIGRNPDVLKFSTSSVTGANGEVSFANVEWDTYSFILNESSYDLVGTIPLAPLTINPSSSVNFRFVLQPANPPSLLVTIKDAATGAPISNASVNLSRAGFSETLITGHATVGETDWSANQYSSQSGGIDASGTPGSLMLLANASGTYQTSTVEWLISNTIDFGGSSTTLYGLRWNPFSQPPQTGFQSLKFQLAGNNDSSTWNFIGPDGATNSYYADASSSISGLNGNRYLRYKAFLGTQDGNYSPRLDDITVEFNSTCVPQSQALFNNLTTGAYFITAAASGYGETTSSVAVSGDWQQSQILLYSQ
jgi:type II secretory pathway pseudopilin PulG